jgi:hypothetical protein
MIKEKFENWIFRDAGLENLEIDEYASCETVYSG